MRKLFCLFLALIIASQTYAQKPKKPIIKFRYDSLGYSIRIFETHKMRQLLIGYNFQQTKTPTNPDSTFHYIEIGYNNSTLLSSQGFYNFTTYGLGTEILIGKKTIVGFKASAWRAVMPLVGLGINGIFYTDFRQGNIKIRPEILFGAQPFKLSFGVNIPFLWNNRFERLKDNWGQITFNALIKTKTVEKTYKRFEKKFDWNY
ncbi:MAG: hypothetical protein EAZ95_15930 [Bacteroidetes bacterium]|nr:MAG: hypothetical protein EAZ95_15930 [Bacteroidota bacterium]